jgi:hypothetical protein
MLFRETAAFFCENRTEHTNTPCGQIAEFYRATLLSYLDVNRIELAHGSFESVNMDMNLRFPLIVFSRIGLWQRLAGSFSCCFFLFFFTFCFP